MSATVSADFLLRVAQATPGQVATIERFLQATEEQQAAIDRFLTEGRGLGKGVGITGPRYVLQKGLRGWRLVFDGLESVLPDEKGVGYVAVLLMNPPREPVHGAEVAHRAFGDAIIEDQRSLVMDDKQSTDAMRLARRSCQAVIDDPDASQVEREEARGELEEIAAWARKHMRGTEGGEQRQVRAIRQAIRRLLESLRGARDAEGEPDEVLRAFGEHLERYLWRPSGRGGHDRNARVRAGLAGRFTYEPPEGVRWSG
jgi:hypothetical protein